MLRTNWFIALLVFFGANLLYLRLPATAYNPDGLRVFPALRTISFDSTGALNFTPLPWQTAYQEPYYTRANVQKHFLFPLYAQAAYHLFGQGSGLRALQTANALSAAIAVALFALLLISQKITPLLTLALSIGLAFSNAFFAQAVNIAEAVPALPWLMLALLVLMRTPLTAARSLFAGACLGISAGCYFVSAAAGTAFLLSSIRRRNWHPLLIAFLTMLVTTASIYVITLILAGNHASQHLAHQLFFMPEQGTYGGFRLTHLGTVLLGFANSVLPTLPENFSGMRNLLSQLTSGYRTYLEVMIVPLFGVFAIAFFGSLYRSRRHLSGTLVRPGIAFFVTLLIICLLWDPYHQKLWVYSNIGLWLMIAGFLAPNAGSSDGRLTNTTSLSRVGLPRKTYGAATPSLTAQILFAAALFLIVAINLARRITGNAPNPKWQVAQRIAELSTADHARPLWLGGWDDVFDYLVLLVPSENLLSVPDLILEQGRDSSRVFARLTTVLQSPPRSVPQPVYAVNLFDRDESELRVFYDQRLKFPQFRSWLVQQKPSAELVWYDSLTSTSLHRLRP